MYTQTVFEAGNSLVVTIPKAIARKMNLKHGSKVVVSPTEENRFIVEKPVSAKPVKKVAEKAHREWLKTFIEENSEILDELAKH